MMSKICEECGNEIVNEKHDFCSENCWRIATDRHFNEMTFDGEIGECDDCKRLEDKIYVLESLLSKAKGDMYQTARTNQCNLTGIDLTFPEDGVSEMSIGKRKVNQHGIDETLNIIEDIQTYFSGKSKYSEEESHAEGMEGQLFARFEKDE
jgi:hypothetical protein